MIVGIEVARAKASSPGVAPNAPMEEYNPDVPGIGQIEMSTTEQEITREEDDTDMSDGERVSNNVTVEKLIDGTKENLAQNEAMRDECNAPEMERSITDSRAEGDIVKEEGQEDSSKIGIENAMKDVPPLPQVDTAEDSDDIPLVVQLGISITGIGNTASEKSILKKRRETYFKASIGKRVRKHFPGYGYYVGRITSYEDGLFHVVYDDGDEEDMDEEELISLRVLKERKEASAIPLSPPKKAKTTNLAYSNRGVRASSASVPVQEGIRIRGVDFRKSELIEVLERPGQTLSGRMCHEAGDWRKVRFLGLTDDKGRSGGRQLVTVKGIDSVKGTTADYKERVPIGWIRPAPPGRFGVGTYAPEVGDLVEALFPPKEGSAPHVAENRSLWWAGKVVALRSEEDGTALIQRPDKLEQAWIQIQKVRLSARWKGDKEWEHRGRGESSTWRMDKIEETVEFEKMKVPFLPSCYMLEGLLFLLDSLTHFYPPFVFTRMQGGSSQPGVASTSSAKRWWDNSSGFDFSFLSLEALAIIVRFTSLLLSLIVAHIYIHGIVVCRTLFLFLFSICNLLCVLILSAS